MNAESPARGEASEVLADYKDSTAGTGHLARTRPMVLTYGTSEAAAAAQSLEKRSIVLSAVLTIIRNSSPVSDEEIAERYEASRWLDATLPDVSESSLRTRRAEAVRQGLVRDTGKRGTTKRGSSCVLWEVIERGDGSWGAA